MQGWREGCPWLCAFSDCWFTLMQVEMPVDKAVTTLLRLGLATETPIDGRISLQAISCSEAYESLKERWNSLLG